MAFIEDLGVRNLIVEAKRDDRLPGVAKVRQQSPGLSFRDVRAMQASVPGVDVAVAAQALHADPGDPQAAGRAAGRLRHRAELPVRSAACGSPPAASSPPTRRRTPRAVCVLGEAARVQLFGLDDPIGQFVKVNEQWFQIDRRRRSAGSRAKRRRGRTRPGSQQCDLRADGARRFCASRTTTAVPRRNRRRLLCG